MAKFCKSKGAELILVSTPSTINWDYACHNGIARFAVEQRLKYIDLNLKQQIVPIDWSKDTKDKGDHLNYTGAEKVTAYMGKYLAENYALTDHRQDADYKKWKKDLKKYLTMIEKKADE